MHPADLETVVGRVLTRLPAPPAPRTLLPRVMAAVHAWTRRPWYQRAWFTWPLAAQIATVVGLIIIAAAAIVAFSMTEAATLNAISPRFTGVSTQAAALAGSIDATIGAARIIWNLLIQPVVPYLFGLVALMCCACAALGAVLTRVAFERI